MGKNSGSLLPWDVSILGPGQRGLPGFFLAGQTNPLMRQQTLSSPECPFYIIRRAAFPADRQPVALV
jgi:hypothetical protein